MENPVKNNAAGNLCGYSQHFQISVWMAVYHNAWHNIPHRDVWDGQRVTYRLVHIQFGTNVSLLPDTAVKLGQCQVYFASFRINYGVTFSFALYSLETSQQYAQRYTTQNLTKLQTHMSSRSKEIFGYSNTQDTNNGGVVEGGQFYFALSRPIPRYS